MATVANRGRAEVLETACLFLRPKRNVSRLTGQNRRNQSRGIESVSGTYFGTGGESKRARNEFRGIRRDVSGVGSIRFRESFPVVPSVNGLLGNTAKCPDPSLSHLGLLEHYSHSGMRSNAHKGGDVG